MIIFQRVFIQIRLIISLILSEERECLIQNQVADHGALDFALGHVVQVVQITAMQYVSDAPMIVRAGVPIHVGIRVVINAALNVIRRVVQLVSVHVLEAVKQRVKNRAPLTVKEHALANV